MFSLNVQFCPLASYIIVLSFPVPPNKVIPPPLAVTSSGLETLPNIIFLSSTTNVSESKKTVLPSTVKLP